jgi:hypothetical protein
MMVEGHKCDLVYYDPYPNKFLEEYVRWVRCGLERTLDEKKGCKGVGGEGLGAAGRGALVLTFQWATRRSGRSPR